MPNIANENLSSGDIEKPEVQLVILCDLLNDEVHLDRRDEFRSLVKRWLDAGSLEKIARANTELWRDVREELQPNFMFHGTGAAWGVKYAPPNPDLPQAPEQWAMRNFAFLMFNPLRDKLRGPCDRCKKYFIKKRGTKRWCSQSCGTLASNAAIERAEHRALLKSAAKFWTEWTPRKHPNRHFWVAGRVNREKVVAVINGKSRTVRRSITATWISRNVEAIADHALTSGSSRKRQKVEGRIKTGPSKAHWTKGALI